MTYDARPRRILFVCAFLNQHGGFENYVHALARSASGEGHAIGVFTPFKVRGDATIRRLAPRVDFSSAQENWRRRPGGRFLHLLARARFRILHRRPPSALEEAQLAREASRSYVDRFWEKDGFRVLEGFDLVHLVGKPKRFLVDAAVAARSSGKGVVYSEVARVDRRYAEQSTHGDFVEKSNVCDLILAYSESQLDGIRKWFRYSGPARVIDQFAYVNEDELLQIERSYRARKDGELVLGSLCRLSPEKDLDLLLRAFDASRRRHPGLLRLWIAGTGELESELRELARRLHLDSAVSFLGYVRDAADFYRSIDVFVITSREEGGPITGVEAMAAALPIVTTPTNAMPERLRDGHEALFFGVGAVDELSESMCRLAEDELLREKLGKGARRRYFERCHSRVTEPAIAEVWNGFFADAEILQ